MSMTVKQVRTWFHCAPTESNSKLTITDSRHGSIVSPNQSFLIGLFTGGWATTITILSFGIMEVTDSTDGNNSLYTRVQSQELPNQLMESTAEKELIFPEGGLYGWTTVAGSVLVQFCTFGYVGSFGVYQDFYVREYLTHDTPSRIGWIGGFPVFLTFSMGLFTGKAFDMGTFRPLMVGSVLLHALGLFTLSLSHENQYYQVFLAHGLCVGLSSGLSFVPSLAILSHHFQRRRSLAMGIVSAGASLGATVHPVMLNRFFHGSLGFHNGVRVSAAINTSLLILANLLMRTNFSRKKASVTPQIGEFFRDPPYLFMIFAGILGFSGFLFPAFYLQLYAISQGIDQNIAFYSASILNASSIFGRIISNSLVPQLGVLNLVILCLAAPGIMILCMNFVKDVTGTVLFAIFFGFFAGGGVSLITVAFATLAKDESEIGARMGIAFTFCGIMGLFSSPIIGAILTSELHWLKATLFAGITMIAAAGCVFVTRIYVVRRKNTQWV